METFGQRFSRLRKQKGLTQEDIATRINISPQAVSKWENDISSPDISILSQLADILGCTLDELLGKKNDETVNILKQEDRKDINSMVLRVVVNSSDDDKVKINLPMALIKVCLETGINMPQINGNSALKDIDFKQIFDLVEQGVVGKLMEVESKDGDTVYITVE